VKNDKLIEVVKDMNATLKDLILRIEMIERELEKLKLKIKK